MLSWRALAMPGWRSTPWQQAELAWYDVAVVVQYTFGGAELARYNVAVVQYAFDGAELVQYGVAVVREE